eukprot:CAMPEP_0115884984 /NCGR_PEP_ID=MMETSP0287-20121206/30417_1 /TAXON_ID=412157 /ORGANISM="Chrysochromulina rotalis, Strain UIO044" /LENGTH=208 /DNA_ID=CAMNT_0003341341 /DNA_START=569 /DNA_END=1196 /DNA_ORIENTATION=+
MQPCGMAWQPPLGAGPAAPVQNARLNIDQGSLALLLGSQRTASRPLPYSLSAEFADVYIRSIFIGLRSPSIYIISSSQQQQSGQPQQGGQRTHETWQQRQGGWQPEYRGPQWFSMQSHSQHSVIDILAFEENLPGAQQSGQHRARQSQSTSSRCGPQQMQAFMRFVWQRQSTSHVVSASAPHAEHHCSSKTQHVGPKMQQHALGAHAL